MSCVFRCSLSLAFLVAMCSVATVAKAEDNKAPDDPELKKDFAALQGVWEYHKIDGGRILKTHNGNQTTLAHFDSSGKLASNRGFMTEFKLEKSGEVKIFTFAREHEQLDNKKEAMSYIYRLDGDTLYEVPALLLNRNSWTDKPMIVVWHRVIKPAN